MNPYTYQQREQLTFPHAEAATAFVQGFYNTLDTSIPVEDRDPYVDEFGRRFSTFYEYTRYAATELMAVDSAWTVGADFKSKLPQWLRDEIEGMDESDD